MTELVIGATKKLIEASAFFILGGCVLSMEGEMAGPASWVGLVTIIVTAFCIYHDHIEAVRERRSSLWRHGRD